MGFADFMEGRGEAIAHIRLASLCRIESNRPYFVPHYLGEKCETFDFLVELVDACERTPFLFVQVNEFLDQSVERIVAWYEVVEAVLIA